MSFSSSQIKRSLEYKKLVMAGPSFQQSGPLLDGLPLGLHGELQGQVPNQGSSGMFLNTASNLRDDDQRRELKALWHVYI